MRVPDQPAKSVSIDGMKSVVKAAKHPFAAKDELKKTSEVLESL